MGTPKDGDRREPTSPRTVSISPPAAAGLRDRRVASFSCPSTASLSGVKPKRPRAESDFVLSQPRRRALITVETSWLPQGRAPSVLPRVSCRTATRQGRRDVEIVCDRTRRTTVRVDARLAFGVAALMTVGSASAFGGRARLFPRGPRLNAAAIPFPAAGTAAAGPCVVDAGALLPTYPAPAKDATRLERAVAYLDRDSCGVVASAIDFAAKAHKNQRRKDGKPFVTHPIHVATILAELKMDASTVVAGLLHDTVEDTATTLDDIRVAFGDEVASIVAGVTDADDKPDAANQAELLLAMGREWRVALVKLADRLHNMRTLGAMPRHKRVKKATETLEVFVPLASQLGVDDVSAELLKLSASEVAPLGGLSQYLPGLASVVAKQRVPGKLDATLAALDVSMDQASANWQHHKRAARPFLSPDVATSALY